MFFLQKNYNFVKWDFFCNFQTLFCKKKNKKKKPCIFDRFSRHNVEEKALLCSCKSMLMWYDTTALNVAILHIGIVSIAAWLSGLLSLQSSMRPCIPSGFSSLSIASELVLFLSHNHPIEKWTIHHSWISVKKNHGVRKLKKSLIQHCYVFILTRFCTENTKFHLTPSSGNFRYYWN